MAETIQKRYIPWVVACALFMEQLDSTIVNTAVPAIAESLQVSPLNLKVIVSSYILALALCIPLSGWMADRFGSRKIFSVAIALFTASSIICGLSVNLPMLVLARIVQGGSAAMMMPVGRLIVIRSFSKAELLTAMNFVTIPALIGPLLGPTIGGLIVNWLSWREIFFINVPVGLAAYFFIQRYIPDYHADNPRKLDVKGLILFGCGTALLSWILEVFSEHELRNITTIYLLVLSLFLIFSYILHARKAESPLLRLSLFRLRTFRISVLGGFLTRLGIGGIPFLLPLLFQLGLGFPAWKSGLLLMPSAIASITMKFCSVRLLSLFGYRKILTVNTVLMGCTIVTFSLVFQGTPIIVIVTLSIIQGFFSSLQFTSINSMAYCDIEDGDSSMASTIASSLQQMSMSFGLALSSLIAGWFLQGLPQSNHDALMSALHHTFVTIGIITIVSSVSFWKLHPQDGENVTQTKIK